MSVDSNLIHRCTIERPGKSIDAYRNTRYFYGPYLRGVPCRLVEETERYVSDAKTAPGVVKTYTLLVGPDADLQELRTAKRTADAS